MDIKISVIMPCYYSSDVIRQALTMLSWQTRKDAMEVILINDCSPNTDCKYMDLLEEFGEKMAIKYLETEKNSGPGVCRQLGLDNCSAPWVMFHDDDDMLNNIYVIETFLNVIESIPEDVLITNIYAPILVCSPFNYTKMSNHSLGSLINLNILKMFNIRFTNLTYEEDSFLNLQYEYYCNRLESFFPQLNINSLYLSNIEENFISYTKKMNLDSICSSLKEYDRAQKALEYLNKVFKFYISLPNDDFTSDFLSRNFQFIVDYYIDWAERASNFEFNQEQINKISAVYFDFCILLEKYPNMIDDERLKKVKCLLSSIGQST